MTNSDRLIKFSIFVLLLCIIFVNGCWRQPWEIKEYIPTGPPRDYVGDNLVEYLDYSVNGVVFSIFLRSQDEGLYSGEGPYYLCLKTWAEQGNKKCFIKKIRIKSDQSKEYLIAQDDIYPVQLTFGKFEYRYDDPKIERYLATWKAPLPMSLDFDKGEKAEIIIDAEVDGVSRQIIFKIKPVLREGKTRAINV